MEMLKNVKQDYVVVGSIIDYSLQVTNTDTTRLDDIILSDILTGDLEFVPSSVKLGIQVLPGANIITGVHIGSLEVGESKTVTFKAKVLSNLNSPIKNIAEGRYTYRVEEDTIKLGMDQSNQVQISVFNPHIKINKTANRMFIMQGEELSYTVELTNNGNLNAKNVVFRDDLPDEVILIQGTFTINGQQINQVEIEKGINVGDIDVGATVTVKYTVKLVDSECKGWMNNQAYIKFNYIFPNDIIGEVSSKTGEPGSFVLTRIAQLMIDKLPHEAVVSVGDTIEYTLQVANLSTDILRDVIISDRLPEQLQFILGSIKVDTQPIPEGNIVIGINIGTLIAEQTKTITFKVKVLCSDEKMLFNIAEGMYRYTMQNGKEQRACTESMAARVAVSYPHLKVEKKADKDFSALGDQIIYTVNIKNDGDLDAYNVIFRDELPKEVGLVPGSFSINGHVVQEVEIGKDINIGDIFVKESVVITYKVCVISTNCQGYMKNEAFAAFNYNLPNGVMGEASTTKACEDNSVTIMLAISNFKQFNIESYLTIPESKPCIETMNTVTGTIDILNSHVIETPKLISVEGQKLTGYKLIVRGLLQLVIEYTELDEKQSVHSAHYAVPFSTFIILSPSYTVGSRLEVDGLVEDVFYKGLDIRNFFANTTALINVKILGC